MEDEAEEVRLTDKIASYWPSEDQIEGDIPSERSSKIKAGNLDASYCLDKDNSSQRLKFYCAHTVNYPDDDYIEGLLSEKFPNLEEFFNKEVVMPLNISERSGRSVELVCKSQSKVIYPESGRSTKSDWTYIVNTPEHKQGVVIEQCEKTDVMCGEDTGLTLPLRYKATCEQKYMYRYLVAFANATDKSLSGQYFLFPSCCKCVVRVVW